MDHPFKKYADFARWKFLRGMALSDEDINFLIAYMNFLEDDVWRESWERGAALHREELHS